MTNEELKKEIELLKETVNKLVEQFASINDYSKLPITLENALIQRGFTKTTPVTGLAGSSDVYVASSSGGPVTQKITFQNGIRVS